MIATKAELRRAIVRAETYAAVLAIPDSLIGSKARTEMAALLHDLAGVARRVLPRIRPAVP